MAAVTLSGMDFKVTFQLRAHSTETAGSIRIDDLTNYVADSGTSYSAGQTIKSYFVITGPDGSIITGTTYGEHINTTIAADGLVQDNAFYETGSLGAATHISETTNFSFNSGSYTVTMNVQINGADTASHSETFTVDYTRPTITNRLALDCNAAKLTSNDGTQYSISKATVTTERAHTLRYPPGVFDDDITSTSKTLVMASPLYTGLVTSDVQTKLTYDFSASGNLNQQVFITDVATGGGSLDVACQHNTSQLDHCVRTLNAKYEAAQGTNATLANQLYQDLTRVSQLLHLYNEAVSNEDPNATTYFTSIANLTGCTSATAPTSTTPTIITATGGTTGINSLSGSSTINVTESGTGNFIIEANTTNILGTIENNAVEASDGITASDATAAGVKTYTIKPTATNSMYNAQVSVVIGTSDSGNSATLGNQTAFGDDFRVSSNTVAVTNTTMDATATLTISGFFSATSTPDANYKVSVDLSSTTDRSTTPTRLRPVIVQRDSSSNGILKIGFEDKLTGLLLSSFGINELFNNGSGSTVRMTVTIHR